jgi:hypothetical protein
VQWKRLATLVAIVLATLVVSLAWISWYRAHHPRPIVPILIPGNPPVRHVK